MRPFRAPDYGVIQSAGVEIVNLQGATFGRWEKARMGLDSRIGPGVCSYYVHDPCHPRKAILFQGTVPCEARFCWTSPACRAAILASHHPAARAHRSD